MFLRYLVLRYCNFVVLCVAVMACVILYLSLLGISGCRSRSTVGNLCLVWGSRVLSILSALGVGSFEFCEVYSKGYYILLSYRSDSV